jgi:predicted Zn-dependent peptidase
VQEYVLSELDSGERLITERVPSVRSVSLGFWIGAGSRDEPDGRAGVSHFIEHLLFKGTRAYEARQIAEIFDEMGGELNAATSREHTVVYARVPDRHLEDALDVMADMVFAPTFADLDSEREVVLEEIAMVEDAPQDLVHDLLSDAVFSGHPLGRPVIGRAEVISSVSRRALLAYHRRAYCAGNIVLAAAGNLEHDRLLELLQRSARQRVEPPAQKTRVRSPLVRQPGPSMRFQQKDTEQFHVCVGAPGISRSDRRRFAASLLDAILGGSASSRLFQEIREKRGMAYTVYSFGSQYTDTGLVGIYVGTREENLEECFQIVAEQIADIAAGQVGLQVAEPDLGAAAEVGEHLGHIPLAAARRAAQVLRGEAGHRGGQGGAGAAQNVEMGERGCGHGPDRSERTQRLVGPGGHRPKSAAVQKPGSGSGSSPVA